MSQVDTQLPPQRIRSPRPLIQSKVNLRHIFSIIEPNLAICSTNNYPQTIITNDQIAAEVIDGTIALVTLISRTDRSPFFVSKKITTNYLLREHGPKILDSLAYVSPKIQSAIQHFPVHSFHPYVIVYLQALADNQDTIDLMSHAQYPQSEQSIDFMAKRLNSLAYAIRDAANSQLVRKEQKNRKRAYQKNLNDLFRYLEWIASHACPIKIYRLVLGYQLSGTWQKHPTPPVTAADAVRDRDTFIRNVRSDQILKQRIGYTWTLEYALERGFQMRFWCFFGEDNKTDQSLGKQLGDLWVKTTSAKGCYYLFDGIPSVTQDTPTFSVIRPGEHAKLKALKLFAKYNLVLPSLNQRLEKSNAGRTFGKGEQTKPRKLSKVQANKS